MGEHPPQISDDQWADMPPVVRRRFHDMGNHITRLEGIITGLGLRVPTEPGTIPVLQEKVKNLESGQASIETKVDKVDSKIDKVREKLDGLTVRVVSATTVVGGIMTFLVQHYAR